jgi:hypothetical protein
MTLLTMTIPDDPADLPRWLERRLMAPDFGRFVAELSAHFPATPAAAQPRYLLDRWLPVALDQGLAPIPADVLSQLLRHPAVLAAFQERVATYGGAYWDDLPGTAEDLSERLDQGKRSLKRILSTYAPSSNGAATPKASPKAVPSGVAKRTGGRGYKIWAVASTGVAACLVVAVVVLASGRPDAPPPIPKVQIAWGWGKPGGLATDQSNPSDYLNKLAAAVEEWSVYRPGDPAGVGIRLAELRLGCTLLMHSTYGPLVPADRAWLLDYCRTWAKALDGHQQVLDAGTDPLAVRAMVDETVRAIAATLREKAKRVG